MGLGYNGQGPPLAPQMNLFDPYPPTVEPEEVHFESVMFPFPQDM